MTDHDFILPPPAYFEERAALALLVPRAKVLAALADALGTAPAGDTVTIPRAPNAALLRPFISCPEAELPEAWEAMLRIAATMAGRAALPAPPAALGAPGEVVKAIREYLGVHPDLQLGGQVLDSMALDLARISLDFPADLIGALALEELMQLGYTVEAGAILPPRDLPEMACEFFGVRPVGRVPALKPVERQALEGLCAVAAAAHHVADDSPYDGATVAVEYGDMEALGQALDKLEALPDDQPGYLMGPASKAEWALRRLLDAAPLLKAPAAAAEPADEREAFEAWAKAKTGWNPNLERKGEEYAGGFAQTAWEAWRGRGAAPAEPVYQISQPYHTDPKNTWRDASKAAYDVSVPDRRRVLFTRQAAPAAPAGDAETIHLQDLKNALADCTALRQQLKLLDEQQAGTVWRWQADSPDQLETMGNRMSVLIYACDLRALLADATPALGEWIATLEVDSGGGLDYETVPPCTLPTGEYRLYLAAKAKEDGGAA